MANQSVPEKCAEIVVSKATHCGSQSRCEFAMKSRHQRAWHSVSLCSIWIAFFVPALGQAQVSARLQKNAQVVTEESNPPRELSADAGSHISPHKDESKDSALATVVVVIGDSLSEGLGVERSQAFPDRAQEILRARGYQVRFVNGGISGSVTADADRRLRWYLKIKPDILFLELGGNDALKGTPVSVIKNNLAKVIDLARENHLQVVLAGMQIYENYGENYAHDFAALYPALAREKKIALLPFILKDVALKPELNQPDMKHPNVKGHEIVAHTLADFLDPLLKARQGKK